MTFFGDDWHLIYSRFAVRYSRRSVSRQRLGPATASHLDDLGQDSQSDLFRSLRVDIDPDGRIDPVQVLRRGQPFGQQCIENELEVPCKHFLFSEKDLAHDEVLQPRVLRSGLAAFFDFDADGWLDLYVVNYVDFIPARNKLCPDPTGGIFFREIYYFFRLIFFEIVL